MDFGFIDDVAFILKLLQQNPLNKLSNIVSRCDTVF